MPSLIKVSVYAKPSDRILISELIMPRKGILSSSNTCILSLYIRTKNHLKISLYGNILVIIFLGRAAFISMFFRPTKYKLNYM